MKILLIGITHPAFQRLSDELIKAHDVSFLHYRPVNTSIKEASRNDVFDIVLSIVPIWHVRSLLESMSISFKRLIAFSSTSVISKSNSKILDDKYLADKYLIGEEQIIKMCLSSNADYLILRTTMLWGFMYDKNISRLINTARKYHLIFYPYDSSGLRAPIHFETLVKTITNLITDKSFSKICILSGETKYSLLEIIKKISLKYSAIRIPIIIPFQFLLFLHFVFRLPILLSIAGFFERASLDLDYQDLKGYQHIIVPQPKLYEKI